jgi:hypothetical protein
MTGWGGERSRAGARPKSLLELVEACTFVPSRHDHLLATDDSLLEAETTDERLLAAQACQREYRDLVATREFWARTFSRIARGRRGWERSAKRVKYQVRR